MADPFRSSPPTPGTGILTRTRLLSVLAGRWQRPLTVMVAGAGFGKSTVLAQAMAENALSPRGRDVWLGCATTDASASSLAAGLGAGLDLDLSRSAVDDLHVALCEAVLSRAPAQVSLILDDVHLVPEASGGAALLRALLASLPANGHLVVAGRTEPPLAFARRQSMGDVLRLDEPTLAFTDAELDELARLRSVPSHLLTGLGRWPALTDLVATSGRGRAFDYVAEEIVECLDPAHREVLAALSIVGPFDEEMAQSVATTPVDLDDALRGLPLVAASGPARMLHPLWQQVLGAELTDVDDARVRRQAAKTLTARGASARAMDLLMDGELWDDVCELICTSSGAGHPPVESDVLERWVERLPDAVRSRPEGRLLLAVARQASDPKGSVEALGEVVDDLRAAGNTDAELVALVQLGYLAWFTDQMDVLVGQFDRILELERMGVAQAAGVACLGRAIVADTMLHDDRQVQAEVDRIPPGSLSDELASVAGWLRGQAFLARGDLESAESAVAAVLESVHPHSPFRIHAEGTRLQCLWLSGQIEAAIEAMAAPVDAARHAISIHASSVAASQACYVLALLGRVGEARAHLEATRAASDYPSSVVIAHRAVAEAALAVARGDEPGAAGYLRHEFTALGGVDVLDNYGVLRRASALSYVLVDETRPMWEAVADGVVARPGIELGRALVALRRDGTAPDILPPVGIVRSRLPLPWLAELAVAGVAGGLDSAWALIGSVWPDARGHVRRLAESPIEPVAAGARRVLRDLPAPPTRSVDVRVLGPTHLEVGGEAPGPASEWRRPRVRHLLVFLAACGPTTRDRAAAALWPDLDDDAANRNLRLTLHYLLHTLEPDRDQGEAPFVVRHDGRTLELAGAPWVSVDAWEFTRLVDEAERLDRDGAPSQAVPRYESAVALWRGDCFEEVAYEEWAQGPRQTMRSRFVAAALRVGELLVAGHDPARAVRHAHRVLELDRWSERAHRLLVGAHTAAGDRLAAATAARDYRDTLVEAGFDPDDADHLMRDVQGT